MDLVEPSPRTTRAYCYIFTVCDCFSKYLLTFLLRVAIAPTATKQLEEQVILVYRVPRKIIANNGVQFRSKRFKSTMKEYNIDIAYTANYHPQANPVVKSHRVIRSLLSAYVNDNHDVKQRLTKTYEKSSKVYNLRHRKEKFILH